MLRAPHQLIAMSGGLGLLPQAPGTFGSLAGFALFAALQVFPLPVRLAAYVLLFALFSWAAGRTERDFGKPDLQAIVVDETIGMSLTLEFAHPTLLGWAAAFLLFRAFDMAKPWPVNLAHGAKAGGGVLVILDDVGAALYAGLAVAALHAAGLP